MKKQLYAILLAMTMVTATTIQAGCFGGRCGVKKERVKKERGCSTCHKTRGCANGTCGA